MADISPQNVLVEAEDESFFKDIEAQELQNPSTPIMNDGVPVYKSRTTTLFELSGIPILTDFGQMRLAEPRNNDWWMSDLYRAPEVLLKLPWSFAVDIWSVGVMVSKKSGGREPLLTDIIRHSSFLKEKISSIPLILSTTNTFSR